tara:strand:- start:2718 stop:3068 length:351 start_codon:yes stop_codon:yes gene_type:complete
MGELIQFPTGKRLKPKPKSDEELIKEIVDELVDISQHLFDVLDDEVDAISKHDLNLLNGINLRDENARESRDSYVIVNLIYAMLSRYLGMEHSMHKELDTLFVKIKAIQKETEDDR